MTDRGQYTPGPACGAQIQKDGEKWTLILIRELRHPAEKVWEALTDPAHLRQWAPFDADGSLGTVGTTVKLTTVRGPTPYVSEAHVKRADAPRALEYSWGRNDFRWELESLGGGGTRLTLWHSIDRRFISMGAAGWHICFDVLDRLLSGTPIGRIVAGKAMKCGWPRLNSEYAKQFRIETPTGRLRWYKRSESRGLQDNRGGPVELEQVGSADPALGVHCLYGGCPRQRRRRGTEEVYLLGGPHGAASPRLAPVDRSVLVRAAVCRHVAQRATQRLNWRPSAGRAGERLTGRLTGCLGRR